MELLRTPIAIVDPSFVEDSLLRDVRVAIEGRLSAGGILLVSVDALREGDYILERIRSWAVPRGLECTGVFAAEEDPYLVWLDLVGDADSPGTLTAGARLGLVLVSSSCVIPASLLSQWSRGLESHASASRKVIVAPLMHSTCQELSAVGIEAHTIQVPEFRQAPPAKRHALSLALLEQELGPCRESEEAATQLIDRDPSSRTELENWVDGIVDLVRKGDPVDFGAVCRRRLSTRAPEPKSRDALSSLLRAANAKLAEADTAFQAWQGRSLVQPVRPLHDPFEARDALHWFVGVISHVSSRLDCVDGAFWKLVKLRKEIVSTEVVWIAEPQIFRELRSLRTLFQHGLDERDRKDRATVETAETWLSRRCGSAEPGRHQWRSLTWAILTQWDEVVTSLRDLMRVVADCSAREAIELEIQQAARRLLRHQWREIARGAIGEIDPGIDIDQFVEKHHEQMASDLKATSANAAGVMAAAEGIASRAVAAESAACPLQAKDLLGLGIEPGPTLGKVLKEAYALWDKDPQLSKQRMLTALGRKFPALFEG